MVPAIEVRDPSLAAAVPKWWGLRTSSFAHTQAAWVPDSGADDNTPTVRIDGMMLGSAKRAAEGVQELREQVAELRAEVARLKAAQTVFVYQPYRQIPPPPHVPCTPYSPWITWGNTCLTIS